MAPTLPAAPLRNASVVGSQVYSHSGEFSPLVIDVEIPCRGLWFRFARKYRCENRNQIGPLGRGWTFSYAKRIDGSAQNLVYHDGEGRVYRFASDASLNKFVGPSGLYAAMTADENRILLRSRFGCTHEFASPLKGGRLQNVKDRNGNILRLDHEDGLVTVTDSFDRQTAISFKDGCVSQVRDPQGRVWNYIYDTNRCLIEVGGPRSSGGDSRSRVTKYSYDEHFRLISITDPRGQKYLQNSYDQDSRVIRQDHGSGFFSFSYSRIESRADGHERRRTDVRLKNGGNLVLEHDFEGHVLRKTLYVSRASFRSVSPHNAVTPSRAALITEAKYNKHGELVHRVNPSGECTDWIFDEHNEDINAQGNLLRVTRSSAPDVKTDQDRLVTEYRYEPLYQQVVSMTDPRGQTLRCEYDDRGNLTTKVFPPVTIIDLGHNRRRSDIGHLVESFQYNQTGQLTHFVDSNGGSTEYLYYSARDSGLGAHLLSKDGLSSNAGGYLGRVVRRAAKSDKSPDSAYSLEYDDLGNVVTYLTGKQYATRIDYDVAGRILSVTAPAPHSYTIRFAYDDNDNLIARTESFDRFSYDSGSATVGLRRTILTKRYSYNILNNIIEHSVSADGSEYTHRFLRDASENIVRVINARGTVFNYDFDERDLIVGIHRCIGTPEESDLHYAYTPGGKLESCTDGLGNTTEFKYDGFGRFIGVVSAEGTLETHALDEIGNVTHVQLIGRPSTSTLSDNDKGERAVLAESWFEYDELSRLVRINRAWRDLAGTPLGQTKYDDQKGLVSIIFQYSANHLPAKIWTEPGHVLELCYDSAKRITALLDHYGRFLVIEYDENGNPILAELPRASQVPGQTQAVTFRYDELDRLVQRSVGKEPAETFVRNALGSIQEYANQLGVKIKYLHDSFGRTNGKVKVATTEASLSSPRSDQILVRRVEWDASNNAITQIDERKSATFLGYDMLGRLVTVIYPDATSLHYEHDANGNVRRTRYPNGTSITNRFDAMNRLVARISHDAEGRPHLTETYAYDGLGRIVAAANSVANVTRQYSSLSQLLVETVSGKSVEYGYDSAGNQIYLRYAGGNEIHKMYDGLGCLLNVHDRNGRIAEFTYQSAAEFQKRQLGDGITVKYIYQPDRDRVHRIRCESSTGDIILDGDCSYDVIGNLVAETQVGIAGQTGKRYDYDAAGRVTAVRYGVGDPTVSNSFSAQVSYDLAATGAWRRQVIRDPQGAIIESSDGIFDELEHYAVWGKRRFAYEASGCRTNATSDDGQTTRFYYDHFRRLIRLENRTVDERVLKTIEYEYDPFNRQIAKRISRDNSRKEYRRTWGLNALLEEWEDGELKREFVYGSKYEPLKMNIYADREVREYFFVSDVRGFTRLLVDRAARAIELYDLDLLARPLEKAPGASGNELAQNNNPVLTRMQIWDKDTGLFFQRASAQDPSTGMHFMSGPGPSLPDRDKVERLKDAVFEAHRIKQLGRAWLLVGLAAEFIPGMQGPATLIVFVGVGLEEIGGDYEDLAKDMLDRELGKGKGKGPFGSAPGTGSGNAPSGGANSGSDPATGADGWREPSGRPEDAEPSGHTGGGSSREPSRPETSVNGGMTVPEAPTKEPAPKEPDDQKPKDQPKDKPKDKPKDNAPKNDPPKEDPKDDSKTDPPKDIATPNPEDPRGGGGEGIDKNWWRKLPGASVLHEKGHHSDDPENPMIVHWKNSGVAWQAATESGLFKIDPEGESVTLNLSAIHSSGRSTGTSTSDDWGDRPRSSAEAYVAPRIRDASVARY